MVICGKKKSARGIYHIMLRGINCQDIFFDEEDYLCILETMKCAKEIKELLNGQSAGILRSLEIDKRNRMIRQIKGKRSNTASDC